MLRGLDKLRIIELDRNQFIRLPESLFLGLDRLQSIFLECNNLTELPKTLFHGLDKLQVIYLYQNQLSELPESLFSGLDQLQTISLQQNGIDYLSQELVEKSLELLDVANNPLSPTSTADIRASTAVIAGCLRLLLPSKPAYTTDAFVGKKVSFQQAAEILASHGPLSLHDGGRCCSVVEVRGTSTLPSGAAVICTRNYDCSEVDMVTNTQDAGGAVAIVVNFEGWENTWILRGEANRVVIPAFAVGASDGAVVRSRMGSWQAEFNSSCV
jgi:Leucine-rich repeat (LRR) protein